jgi:hypothetical protein
MSASLYVYTSWCVSTNVYHHIVLSIISIISIVVVISQFSLELPGS